VPVIVGTMAMPFSGMTFFDPVVAVLFALVVLYSAGRVVWKSLYLPAEEPDTSLRDPGGDRGGAV